MITQTQSRHTLCHPVFAAALLLAAAPFLHAQKAPAGEEENEEVITLSEFTVSATKLENSYIATETTATRIGDKIIDLPYNIDIFTEDFIQDFNAYDDATIISYIPSSTGGATGSSDLKIRGFSVLQTRDGFQYSMPAASHVTREVIQGPASILYGRATPGGILNAISPRPRQKPSVKTRTAVDTNNTPFLASLIATGPVGTSGNLFYHAYVEYSYKESIEKYVHSSDVFAGTSLLYKFNRDTALTLTIEYQPTRGADGNTPPMLINTGTSGGPTVTNKGIRYWNGAGDFSGQGPDNLRKVQFYGVNLLFEHRINSLWSFRFSGQTGQATHCTLCCVECGS